MAKRDWAKGWGTGKMWVSSSGRFHGGKIQESGVDQGDLVISVDIIVC